MENLVHGFHVGVNNVTATKILKWRRYAVSGLCWTDYLLLLRYCGFNVVDFGDFWLKVEFYNNYDVYFFYNLTCRFVGAFDLPFTDVD